MKADQIEATWQKMGTVDETAVPYYLMLIAAQLADHTDLNRQVLGLWKTIRDAQNERGTAELEAKRLRELCGCVYQFIGANMLELGGCRRFLDALSNASEGRPFDVEHLLPYSPEEPICMTDVAQPASAPQPEAPMTCRSCKSSTRDTKPLLSCGYCGAMLLRDVVPQPPDASAGECAGADVVTAVDAHDNEGRN